MRKQAPKPAGLRFGVALWVAAMLAIGLPSAAAAKSSHGHKGTGQDKHQDQTDGNGSGDAPAPSAPAPIALPGSGDGQPVTAFQVPPAKVNDGVATFRLRGIAPKSIRAAYLKQGRKKRRLSLKLVRRAARRGVLRLRLGRKHSARRHLRASTSRRKKKPTLIVVTDPEPTPAPAPAPDPAPAPAPSPSTSWRAAGSPPLADAVAASLVAPRAEIRPNNYTANHYLPTDSELSAFHNAVYGAGPNAGRRADAYNPLIKYVTGRFTGTTDEIIQWGAHKWGIPEDVLRAVAVNESSWRQDAMGDREDGVNASLYPAQSRIDSDSVYESLGITQVKWRGDGSMNPGTEPLRWKSTAFNVDYWGANVSYYYDGLCSWCKPGYTAGQAWESIGAHYEPSPWLNSGMLAYIDHVKATMAARPWAQPGF
jgi:hypothetical protein